MVAKNADNVMGLKAVFDPKLPDAKVACSPRKVDMIHQLSFAINYMNHLVCPEVGDCKGIPKTSKPS
jgi:uncharacterized membrane protein (DUF4010 family)